MRSLLLHLDDALLLQEGLNVLPDAISIDAREIGPNLRLWSRPKALNQLRALLDNKLSNIKQPILTFMGSGDFHHISALLIERLLKNKPDKPITIIHFDNHPDWVKFNNGLHCGSWASYVAGLDGINKVISIGMCSDDMLDAHKKYANLDRIRDNKIVPFALKKFDNRDLIIDGSKYNTIEEIGEENLIKQIRDLVKGSDIYLTIDKDVLSEDAAATNWDQGELELETMFDWLMGILEGNKLIGADIVGDVSVPSYGKNIISNITKTIESKMDQPNIKNISPDDINLNCQTNLKIYQFLSQF